MLQSDIQQNCSTSVTEVHTRCSVLAPTGGAPPTAAPGFETSAAFGFTVAVGVVDTGFVGRGGAGGGRVGISPDALAFASAAGGGAGVSAAGGAGVVDAGGEGVAAGVSALAAGAPAGAAPVQYHTYLLNPTSTAFQTLGS